MRVSGLSALAGMWLSACGMNMGVHELDGSLRKSDDLKVSANATREPVSIQLGLEQTPNRNARSKLAQGSAA